MEDNTLAEWLSGRQTPKAIFDTLCEHLERQLTQLTRGADQLAYRFNDSDWIRATVRQAHEIGLTAESLQEVAAKKPLGSILSPGEVVDFDFGGFGPKPGEIGDGERFGMTEAQWNLPLREVWDLAPMIIARHGGANSLLRVLYAAEITTVAELYRRWRFEDDNLRSLHGIQSARILFLKKILREAGLPAQKPEVAAAGEDAGQWLTPEQRELSLRDIFAASGVANGAGSNRTSRLEGALRRSGITTAGSLYTRWGFEDDRLLAINGIRHVMLILLKAVLKEKGLPLEPPKQSSSDAKE